MFPLDSRQEWHEGERREGAGGPWFGDEQAQRGGARNQELARMKSLLFYQEQKNKRINKIKSKKYHKIHKKAEERRKEKEREVVHDEI